MLTSRDREVIKSVGDHILLNNEQIVDLHFPSYQVFQRRLRRELKGEYLSKPFYMDTNTKGRGLPIYYLVNKGVEFYEEVTDKKYNSISRTNENINRILQINDLLVELKLEEIIKDFNIDPNDFSVSCNLENEKISFKYQDGFYIDDKKFSHEELKEYIINLG